MRRFLRIATVPALAAFAVAGLVQPAKAATGSLTVTAIDRSGHKVAAFGWLTNSGAGLTFKPGATRRLRNGRYGITVVIAPQGTAWGATQTVGARSFTIKGNHVSLTFDARKGKHITVTASVPNTPYFTYESDTCIDGTYNGGIAHWDGVDNYAIPTTDKHVEWGHTAEWAMSQNGPYYWAITQATGIPADPSHSFAHTAFARLQVSVRKGKVKNPATTLFVVPASTSVCSPGTVTWATFNAPRTVTAYVTAGSWQSYITYNNNAGYTPGTALYYRAGHTYGLTLNRTP